MKRIPMAGFRFELFGVTLIAALVLVGVSPDAAQAAKLGSCAKPSDVEIVQLLNRWRAEFSSGRADRVAALYAADATLLPSKEGKTYQGQDAIRSYYKDFLSQNPRLSIKPSSLSAGCGMASVSGPVIYRIAGERKGTRALLGGRYTAEFVLSGGTWRIVRHFLAADPRSIGDPFEKGVGKSPL